jgi:hypothetical protein
MIPNYWAQVSRDKATWHDRHMVALRQIGVGRAKENANLATARLDEARCTFMNIVPRSMAEILFMARIARDYDAANGAISWVVVDNLAKCTPLRTRQTAHRPRDRKFIIKPATNPAKTENGKT